MNKSMDGHTDKLPVNYNNVQEPDRPLATPVQDTKTPRQTSVVYIWKKR